MYVYLMKTKQFDSLPYQLFLIAERLSARLLILQCVFLVGGVRCHTSGMQFVTLQECNLSLFRNAICHSLGMQLKVWLVHKHLSRLGMQLKYQKVVYAYVSLSFSAL